MKRARVAIALLLLAAPLVGVGRALMSDNLAAPGAVPGIYTTAPREPHEGARFETLDVYADSGAAPLAAWQIEVVVTRGEASIVGVEGGEHAAFAAPPTYDPEALSKGRIIIAAFSLADDLPAGRTRIARLHLRVAGAERPQFTISAEAAANRDGDRIPIETTATQGDPQ